VAVDDHARIGFTDLYPDERQANAVQFLRNAMAYFDSLGVRLKRVLTDNGSAFRSKAFAQGLPALGPQTQLHPSLPASDQGVDFIVHLVRMVERQ